MTTELALWVLTFYKKKFRPHDASTEDFIGETLINSSCLETTGERN